MTSPGSSLSGLLKIAAQLAAIYAEVLARRQEQAAQLEAAHRTAEAEQLRARLSAERDAARAAVAPATVPGWWATASPEQVARTWEVAAAWAPTDPQLAARAAMIEAEVRTRYGVDPRVLLEQARAAREPATAPGVDTTRDGQEQASRDAVETGAVLGADSRAGHAEESARAAARPTAVLADEQARPVEEFDRRNRLRSAMGLEQVPAGFDADADAGTVDLLAAWGADAWDTPAARADRADRAERAAGSDTEAAAAVITADQSQGTPPRAAVTRAATPGKQARKARPQRGAEVEAGR